jgi:hypothetical protein
VTALRAFVLVAAIAVGRVSPADAIDHASIVRTGPSAVELRDSSAPRPMRCDGSAVSTRALCAIQVTRSGAARTPGSMRRGAAKRRSSIRARDVFGIHADARRADSRGDVGFHSRFGRRRQHAPPSDDPPNGEVAI